MQIGTTNRIVISKGSKQKKCSASGRLKDTVMVVYKTYHGRDNYSSKTRHELI
jgi:hypothetical protein